MDKNDEKDFHQIAREIAMGFIGELKHDVDYLSVKLLEYADHPMYREIMRYSQQYLHAGLSEEEQQILDEFANKKANGMEETLEKINFQLFQKDIDKAFDMTESLGSVKYLSQIYFTTRLKFDYSKVNSPCSISSSRR